MSGFLFFSPAFDFLPCDAPHGVTKPMIFFPKKPLNYIHPCIKNTWPKLCERFKEEGKCEAVMIMKKKRND